MKKHGKNSPWLPIDQVWMGKCQQIQQIFQVKVQIILVKGSGLYVMAEITDDVLSR